MKLFFILFAYGLNMGFMVLYDHTLLGAILAILVTVCCASDYFKGEIPIPLCIIFLGLSTLKTITLYDYINFGSGILILFVLLIIHNFDGPDGEPLIGGADVLCIPAIIMFKTANGTLMIMSVTLLFITLTSIARYLSKFSNKYSNVIWLTKMERTPLLSYTPFAITIVSIIDDVVFKGVLTSNALLSMLL